MLSLKTSVDNSEQVLKLSSADKVASAVEAGDQTCVGTELLFYSQSGIELQHLSNLSLEVLNRLLHFLVVRELHDVERKLGLAHAFMSLTNKNGLLAYFSLQVVVQVFDCDLRFRLERHNVSQDLCLDQFFKAGYGGCRVVDEAMKHLLQFLKLLFSLSLHIPLSSLEGDVSLDDSVNGTVVRDFIECTQ